MSSQETLLRLLRLVGLIHNQAVAYNKFDLAKILQVSERTILRYIETLNSCGFEVQKRMDGGFFFNKVQVNPAALLHLSLEESSLLQQSMDNIKGQNALKKTLAEKLQLLTDKSLVSGSIYIGRLSRNIEEVNTAIENKKQLILRNYFSANTQALKDRLVEPISLTENRHYLVAFDVNSQFTKIFKLDRCASVSVLKRPWQYEALHEQKEQDLFHVSGVEVMEVNLKLKNRAKALLEEEYPAAIGLAREIEDEHFHFEVNLPVRGWAGVGRFVLGLINDVKVESPDAFKDYLNEKIAEADWL